MKNKKRIETVEEVINFNPNQKITQADKILNINSKKNNNSDKHSMRFRVNQKLIVDFEKLLNKFKNKTEAYFTYPSKGHFFETGCFFLEELYIKQGLYYEATPQFIQHITRRGNRPNPTEDLKIKEHLERKGDGVLYFTPTKRAYDIYYNLIYSFLISKKDQYSLDYSAPYFIKDFIELLTVNFKDLCLYEKNNPRN